MESRVCKGCGIKFIPKYGRHFYCGNTYVKTCPVCGKEFEYKCASFVPVTCSKACAGQMQPKKTRICPICGEEFQPKRSNQQYCNKIRIVKCPICGKEYSQRCTEQEVSKVTCGSRDCISKHMVITSAERYGTKNPLRKCKYCDELFKPRNNTHCICDKPQHEFTCKACGRTYYLDTEYLKRTNPSDVRQTCSLECECKLKSQNNAGGKPETLEKMSKTCQEKYGVDWAPQSPEIQNKMWNSYQRKTGYDHPSHNPEVRSKSAKHARKSKLEDKVRCLFSNFDIEYFQHYFITNEDRSCSHEFDFFLPKYKILIDTDGVYYHSYLSDPDGCHSNDYYDDIRVSLIPKDYSFYVIIEGSEEKQVKKIVEILKSVDAGIFDYNSYLFNWCRSIEFPYPSYTDKRLAGDWSHLCQYQNVKYVNQCRIGESLIKQFHPSIFECRVGTNATPVEAWYDDALLKRVIQNRLIYINDVDPSKILRGFNISKICPVVSMFNPVLAKYLTVKYLSDFNEVFDPFSGFSGRLLGVASAGKRYIGQDLNPKVVDESNQLISYLHLDNCTVVKRDILQSSDEYECLLTCSPYGHKEIYNEETIFKSCDEWIDECLTRFRCKRYVFVVDETAKYADHVAEVIKSTSHFASVQEKVIVID